MNDRARQTALSRWINGIFQEGLVLTPDVARFMEGAFGTNDPEVVLSGAGDSDTDSLLELLCYPDHDLQVRFESDLGHGAFTTDDQRAAVVSLCREPLKAVIKSPDGKPLTSVDIPAFALETFIQRLKITWQPPKPLALALATHHPGERGLTVRVHLRNAGLPWHDGQISLMALFLSKMPPESAYFEACLGFLISILSELAPGNDGYDFLIAKKFFYFQNLCRAEDFERKRQTSNMEILMLQGERAAHGSIEQWRLQMRQVDLICQALFGRTQFFQQPGEHCLDLDSRDSARQIQDVMRLLS